MGECPHQYFRDVETCPICEAEAERDEIKADYHNMIRKANTAEWERDAALAEVERLTRDLEEMRETMHTQADAAQQRILTLEVENLRLKQLLSPVEEG